MAADLPETANRQRLLEMVEFLETQEVQDHFNMTRYHSSKTRKVTMGNTIDAPIIVEHLPISKILRTCGATCCIAGFVNLKYGTQEQIRAAYEIATEARLASKLLGLDFLSSTALFTPLGVTPGNNYHLECTNPKAAALVIRHALETGRVDWHVADDLIDSDIEEQP